MKYLGVVKDDVIVAKAKIYKDFVDERHIELTEEQYNQLTTPCKMVDGKFVPCEYPATPMPEVKPEPTTEELLNIILGVNE